jgi:hypothetical protein
MWTWRPPRPAAICAFQVDVEYTIECLLGHVDQRLDLLRAERIDEEVDAAMTVGGVGDGLPDRRDVARVERDAAGTAAQRRGERGAARAVAPGDDHGGPASGERPRHRLADAAITTGDQRDLAAEAVVVHHGRGVRHRVRSSCRTGRGRGR